MNILRRARPLDLSSASTDELMASVRGGFWSRLGIGAALLVVVALAGLALGPTSIRLDDTVRILLSHLFGLHTASHVSNTADTIVWNVRLPRVLLAGLVGATLGLTGATYQGVFRNPLADPYLIGVATGAALGATIVVVSAASVSWHGLSLLPMPPFTGHISSPVLFYELA